jgi:murein L,D-transpeptidase YafK
VLPKANRPLDAKTRDLIDRRGMEERAPILIRIFKEESKLEVWKRVRETGKYALLKDYDICAWSGVLGPKVKEGDRQAPEGFYDIRPVQMNPNSSYYLSFNIGYPNAFDRSLGRTGSELMVHGACSSRGCYSMTDDNIQEIYTLGRLAFQGGQREFQVQAFPFRMTAEKIAEHRNDPNIPFWLMLKEGYDHFEATGQPPKVDVCDRRYIFNAVPGEGRSFIPNASCPPMAMPEPIRIALVDKQAQDNARMLELAARLDGKEASHGAGAIRVAMATPTSVDRSVALPMSVATGPVPLEPTTTASVSAGVVSQPATPVASTPGLSSVPATATAATAEPAVAAAPATPQVSAPPPEQPVAVAAAPASTPAPAEPQPDGFLPVPELTDDGSETAAAPPPVPAAAPAGSPQPSGGAPETATLEERMLAGSSPPDPTVANSYASASEEDEGLTGMVLKLIRKQQNDDSAAP